MTGSNVEEAVLWNQFRKGEEAAFLAIYRRYVKILFQYGHKFCQDRELVKDLIHDLFVELWKKGERLGPTDAIKFYLFRCLRRKIAEAMRNSHPSAKTTLLPDFPDDPQDFIWISIQSHDRISQLLQKALQTLTPRQKEAVYLHYYDNLSYQEVAGVMGIDLRAAYNLIYKGLHTLRLHLEENTFSVERLPLTTLAWLLAQPLFFFQ